MVYGHSMAKPYCRGTRTDDKLTFLSPNGHEFTSTPHSVLGGSGCAICSGLLPQTKEIVNERIKSRGLCLIGEYQNSSIKTRFKCVKGHYWEATPAHVIHGSGCPHCAGSFPLSKEIVNERLVERKIKLCSDYINATTNAEFQCGYGHKWTTAPSAVVASNGCPI